VVLLLLVWAGAGIILTLLASQKRMGSAGLPLAYFMSLSVIHVPGALLYTDSDQLSLIAGWTRLGFEQSVLGVVAFSIAALLARLAPISCSRPGLWVVEQLDHSSIAALYRLSLAYVAVGIVAHFVLGGLLEGIPSATSIISQADGMFIVGVCLRLWTGYRANNSRKVWSTVAALALLPICTISTQSFIGFSTIWILTIACFMYAQSNHRFAYFLMAPAVVFVGLSLFVNYMAAKNDLRRMTWYAPSPVSDRIQRVVEMLEHFEWLDLSNDRHRQAIDIRLNQNYLIGAAVQNLDGGSAIYVYDAMFKNMISSLIPRIIWPDKPGVGGSGSIVHDLTGLEFAEGTSVGSGQVLDFYASGGPSGVVVGFLICGWVLGRTDRRVAVYLNRGDQRRFVTWFLLAIVLIKNTGGSIYEVTVALAAVPIAGYAINRLLLNGGFARASLPHGEGRMAQATNRGRIVWLASSRTGRIIGQFLLPEPKDSLTGEQMLALVPAVEDEVDAVEDEADG
jgi:energy-coupling factor transporter transmembrane protein EcfT